uniref:SCAN box domain-containing protein n=1 Tax=Pelusios castaneus TaxID=367368 RepID=A0A8C8SAX2_9SAUR
VTQRIREDCWRWLEPDQKTGGQVAEEVALEQFIQVLPPGGKEWVQRHRPKTLAEAVTLTEDYMSAERPGTPARGTGAPQSHPERTNPVCGPAQGGALTPPGDPGKHHGRKERRSPNYRGSRGGAGTRRRLRPGTAGRPDPEECVGTGLSSGNGGNRGRAYPTPRTPV